MGHKTTNSVGINPAIGHPLGCGSGGGGSGGGSGGSGGVPQRITAKRKSE